MKRLVIITLSLVLIVSQASALSDLDTMVAGHNMYASICAAQEIKGNPSREIKTVTYDLSDTLHDIFFVEKGKVTGFGCVCRDQKSETEFLAQCVTACYNFSGPSAGDTCFDAVLSQFMSARSGNDTEYSSKVPGILIDIDKTSWGYIFMLTVIE